MSKSVAMIYVSDVVKSLAWYTSIGFTGLMRFDEDGEVNFGTVLFGKAEVMFNPHGERGPAGVSLWFYTDQVDALYQLLKVTGRRVRTGNR